MHHVFLRAKGEPYSSNPHSCRLLYLTATVCFAYSPVMFLLKNPPGRQENQSLLLRSGSSDVRYKSYANEDDSPEHKQQH